MNNSRTLVSLLSVTLSAPLYGAGFQLQETSAVGLGRAFSAEAAIGDDASVLGANPAAMVLLGGTNYSVSASYIRPGADISGTFSPAGAPAGTNFPTSSSDIGESVIVPAIYGTHQLNDKITIGAGTFTTYGLATDYGSSFLGLGIADKSSLESVNFQPSIAYRVNDAWSIGIGINALYAKGEIDSSVPVGLPGAGNTILGLEGDDIGFGYNIGFLYQPSDSTRFGLHYRSKVDLSLDGEADFIGAPVPGGNPFTNRDTSLDVSLPETLQLSAYHELNPSWAIHGDIKWTAWSRYNGLAPQIEGSPLATGLADAPADWDNAMRYSIGVTHKYSDKFTFRAGLAFDESPVSGGERTLRIPDEERIWATFGFSYAINEDTNFDFGYAHIFIKDAPITEENGTGSFTGEASGDVDIISIGVSGSF